MISNFLALRRIADAWEAFGMKSVGEDFPVQQELRMKTLLKDIFSAFCLICVWLGLILILTVLCAAHATDTAPPKPSAPILHLGDPIPPDGILYSYDSDATAKDFERRRQERDARTDRIKKLQVGTQVLSTARC